MKRVLIAITGGLLLAISVGSCSEKCMTCSENKYVDGSFVETVRVEEFCGRELDNYLDRPPKYIGDAKYQWECE